MEKLRFFLIFLHVRLRTCLVGQRNTSEYFWISLSIWFEFVDIWGKKTGTYIFLFGIPCVEVIRLKPPRVSACTNPWEFIWMPANDIFAYFVNRFYSCTKWKILAYSVSNSSIEFYTTRFLEVSNTCLYSVMVMWLSGKSLWTNRLLIINYRLSIAPVLEKSQHSIIIFFFRGDKAIIVRCAAKRCVCLIDRWWIRGRENNRLSAMKFKWSFGSKSAIGRQFWSEYKIQNCRNFSKFKNVRIFEFASQKERITRLSILTFFLKFSYLKRRSRFIQLFSWLQRLYFSFEVYFFNRVMCPNLERYDFQLAYVSWLKYVIELRYMSSTFGEWWVGFRV